MKRLLVLSVFFWSLCAVALAQVVKVAVLPFKVNAPGQELSYVSKGLQDMLTTRLFVPGQVEVVPPEEVNQLCQGLKGPLTLAKAREIGQRLGVDYVVLGSVTTFGQSVSLDAELIPIKGQGLPIPLYTQAPTLDALVPQLTELSQKAIAALQGHPLSPQALTQRQAPQALPPASKAQAQTMVSPRAQTPVAPKPLATPPKPTQVAKLPPQPVAETRTEETPQGHPVPHSSEVSKRYKYSEIDPWPDYPPEDDDYGAPQPQVTAPKAQKVEKQEKGDHFWSKLLPWNWFRKKKEEPALKKEPITPPPPPPPVSNTGAQTSQTAQAPQTTAPQKNPSPSPPAQAPSQGSWQWY